MADETAALVDKTATLLDRMEDTMRRLTFVMVDFDDDELTEAPQPSAWSPIQIFAHMKASDDLTTPRMAAMLTRDNPPLVSFDVDLWFQIAGYTDAPMDQTLMAYRRHRDETLYQLRRLPAEAWERTGVHAKRGPLSLFDVITTAVEHEEEHVTELEKILEDLKQKD